MPKSSAFAQCLKKRRRIPLAFVLSALYLGFLTDSGQGRLRKWFEAVKKPQLRVDCGFQAIPFTLRTLFRGFRFCVRDHRLYSVVRPSLGADFDFVVLKLD